MTKLLEHALAKVRLWPKERQDEAAEILLTMGQEGGVYMLSDDERAAIEEAREEVALKGVASDEEVAAMWKKHGL